MRLHDGIFDGYFAKLAAAPIGEQMIEEPSEPSATLRAREKGRRRKEDIEELAQQKNAAQPSNWNPLNWRQNAIEWGANKLSPVVQAGMEAREAYTNPFAAASRRIAESPQTREQKLKQFALVQNPERAIKTWAGQSAQQKLLPWLIGAGIGIPLLSGLAASAFGGGGGNAQQMTAMQQQMLQMQQQLSQMRGGMPQAMRMEQAPAMPAQAPAAGGMDWMSQAMNYFAPKAPGGAYGAA